MVLSSENLHQNLKKRCIFNFEKKIDVFFKNFPYLLCFMNRKIYLQSGVFDQARAKSKTLACPLPKGRACKMQQISKTSLYISILEKSVIGRICLIFCIKRLNQNEFKVNVHLK